MERSNSYDLVVRYGRTVYDKIADRVRQKYYGFVGKPACSSKGSKANSAFRKPANSHKPRILVEEARKYDREPKDPQPVLFPDIGESVGRTGAFDVTVKITSGHAASVQY